MFDRAGSQVRVPAEVVAFMTGNLSLLSEIGVVYEPDMQSYTVDEETLGLLVALQRIAPERSPEFNLGGPLELEVFQQTTLRRFFVETFRLWKRATPIGRDAAVALARMSRSRPDFYRCLEEGDDV